MPEQKCEKQSRLKYVQQKSANQKSGCASDALVVTSFKKNRTTFVILQSVVDNSNCKNPLLTLRFLSTYSVIGKQ